MTPSTSAKKSNIYAAKRYWVTDKMEFVVVPKRHESTFVNAGWRYERVYEEHRTDILLSRTRVAMPKLRIIREDLG